MLPIYFLLNQQKNYFIFTTTLLFFPLTDNFCRHFLIFYFFLFLFFSYFLTFFPFSRFPFFSKIIYHYSILSIFHLSFPLFHFLLSQEFVFCKVTEDIDLIIAGNPVFLAVGNTVILQYSAVQAYVLEDRILLLQEKCSLYFHRHIIFLYNKYYVKYFQIKKKIKLSFFRPVSYFLNNF